MIRAQNGAGQFAVSYRQVSGGLRGRTEGVLYQAWLAGTRLRQNGSIVLDITIALSGGSESRDRSEPASTAQLQTIRRTDGVTLRPLEVRLVFA